MNAKTAEWPAPQAPVGMIFDLDGTLVDALEDITASLNHALRSAGMAPRDQVEVRRMVGDGLSALISKAVGADDPDLCRRVLCAYTDHHRLHCLDHTVVYTGVRPALTRLLRAGHPLAVLSNKQHAFTETVVRSLLTDIPFVSVVGIEPSRLRKPDPGAALAIAQCMERRPCDVFLIGDSISDIQTARNAGMRSVAVTWGFRDRDELVAAHPDFVIARPEELLTLALSST